MAAPPTVDGSLADDAWANAPAYSVTFGTRPATVRFVRTATDLYVGVSISDAAFGGTPEFGVYFDNTHNGTKDLGDDLWLGFVGAANTGEDFFYSPTGTGGASHYHDTTGGGTEETTAAGIGASGVVTFEIEHPLCSADTAHDVCLTDGSVVGVDFQYEPGTGGFFDAPGPDAFDPSNNWADLTIGNDTTPPTVAWTAPAAGSMASGTVPLTVDARDNVGVDHVTYEYFYNGRSYPLGSSSDAPYSLNFDTTQFPNTHDALSQTLYATAFDAAGNASTHTGIAIGISNDGAPSLGTVHGSLTNDFIFLQNFWPSTSVHVTVQSPGAAAPIAFDVETDANGAASSAPNGWDLVPGTVITADDGRGQKTLTLVNITITRVDTTTGQVTGTAPAGASVRAFLFTTNGGAQIASLSTTADATKGVWSGVFDATLTAGMHVLADTDSGDNDGDRSRTDFDISPAAAAITITGDGTSLPGAASAAIQGIPTTAITGAQNSGPSGAPLGGIPLGGIPLGGIPLGGIPLGGIPLGGIGLTPELLNENGLGGIPLSTIPLKSSTDSWQARLDASQTFKGSPAQSVTLAQVINTSVVTGVSLKDIDLAGSPLGGIPLGGIVLGGVPLGGIPLGGIPLGGITLGAVFGHNPIAPLDGWCDYINRQPGFSCTDPSTLAGKTVIGLAVEGVPLGGIPLGGIPLGGIPLGGIPLGGIPIGTPLGGIPLGGIDLSGTPLGGIPLGGISLAGTPLGGIPLGGIPADAQSVVLDCTVGSFPDCLGTTTLGAAAAHIRSTAKVQDLGFYGDPPLTLAELAASLPNATLGDLMGTVLAKSAYDWEGLPIPGFPIQDFSSDGGKVNYTVTFDVNTSGSGTSNVAIGVNLPAGARYVPGSTKLNGSNTIPAIEGSGSPVPEPTLDTTNNRLVWAQLPITLDGQPQVLTFTAKPGLTLGTETADALLGGGRALPSVQTSTHATTTITQNFAGNGTATSATPIAADKLYFGYTANGADRDFFSLPLPDAGTLVTVHLSHLHVDDDLVVYGPTVAPLRAPKPAGATTVAPNTTPSLHERTQAIQPEVLADVPVNPPAGESIVGVSDNRGLADESVTFTVPEHSAGAVATIQVTSYDNGYSNEPWMLRVEQEPPLPLPSTCTATPTVTTDVGSTKAMPVGGVGGSTLYLFNSKRFGDLYGGTAESNVWNKLQTLASRTDAAGGTVIPVDAIPSVANKLIAWYGSSCSPSASNDVVRAIGTYLDTLASTYKYVVVVGSYDVLPPGLVLDDTSYVNEREYAPTFLGGTDNLYLSAYALGYLPTDDPYGDTSYSGTGAYIPEAAVGRLVETPTQITSQIDQYVTRGGAVNPTTALVTGYDFLSDGAQAIANNLKPHVPSPTQLISETWTKSDLLNALSLTTSNPVIDSINAHYDHHRLLPADQNTANTTTNLVTTADLAAASLSGRIVITMGCHSGVSVSDLLPDLAGADWDQTYAARGAIDYIANTGFGLGETAGVAYSEQLHALLAQRLDGSMTVGQALMYAKQEYAGSVPTTSGYHLKVIDEADLFGLPMYRIGTGTAPAAPNPQPVVTDLVSGLAATPFSVSPTYTPVSAPTGNYFTVNGDAAYENRRPIEPLIKLDVTEPNLVAHGALVTGLASTDTPNFDAAFSRVVDDRSAFSPELVGDLAFPSKLQAITSFAAPSGQRQRLLLYGGQYRSDDVPDALGVGIQRLYTSLAGIVLYAPGSASDFNAPTFGPVDVSAPDASTIGFAVDINDDSGIDGVKRVVALYNDASGTWRSVDLSHTAGSSRWSGAGTFTGTTSEWFIQAADGSGNVGVTSNKASVRAVAPPSTTGTITIALGATAGATGWFTGDVPATISGAPGVTFSYSVDGAPFVGGNSLTVSGTGVHSIDAQGSDGSQTSTTVAIDITPPTIDIANGIVSKTAIPPVTCNDAGSGIATCDITPSPFDTLGLHTVQVHAVDRAGNVADATGTYTLDAFDGFKAPVDNPPTLNVAKAGSSIPVKFSLGLDLGLGIFATGYPKVQQTACDSGAPQDVIDQTTTATSGLTFDVGTNTYNYVWKTSGAWSGTCQTLIIKLTDGTEHRANFKFK